VTALGLLDLALAAANGILALVLAAVYWRNHRQLRSPFTLGLLLFAAFLLVHNAVIVYESWSMMTIAVGPDPGLLLVDEALQAAASVALLVATMR
jgi:hypothetical protein